MDCWRVKQLRMLAEPVSDAAVIAVLAELAHELEFDYVGYTVRATLPVSRRRTAGLSNYPEAWQRLYAERNYDQVDPVLDESERSVLPFLWTEAMFAAQPALRAEARLHGLEVGWSQACYDGRGVGGLLTLARPRDPISPVELRYKTSRMSWLAQATHAALAERVRARLVPEAAASLTIRELDVLRWTADGHTSAEVSDILAISERTVNYHINKSLLKLNALNKTAAVVKAVRLGLL